MPCGLYSSAGYFYLDSRILFSYLLKTSKLLLNPLYYYKKSDMRNVHQKIQGKVLVTGAGGFIGSHLVKELINRGVKVVCLILPGEELNSLEGFNGTLFEGDVMDKLSLEKVVEDIDTIYHLAGIMESDDPEMFYRINRDGTKNLIEVCRERGVKLKRFVFVSSISAFGPTGCDKKNEDSTSNPINDYGKSKLEAEKYLISSRNPYPYTIIRPVEIYGPGRFDSFYQICRAAKKGFQFNLGQGEITLGYVGDIVRGMIQACESREAVDETYLLGENRIYPLSEVVRIFSEAVRKRLVRIRIPYFLLYSAAFILELIAKIIQKKPIVTRWQVASYVRDCYWKFDVSKAERDFCYQTTVSLPQGARITVDWYKDEDYL